MSYFRQGRRWSRIVFHLFLGWVTWLGTFPSYLMASPTGGTVVEGTATISTNSTNNQHQIITQTTPSVIIEWQQFNIGEGQITQFIQPSPNAIALNRIVGGDPSKIFGTLQADGHVWLINPAGILFGKSAKVDVAGLLATTADISNKNFNKGFSEGKGLYLFSQSVPKDNNWVGIVNDGKITIKDGGMAALVAPAVRNSGVIHAKLSKVLLGSTGKGEYILDLYGDNLIHFSIQQPSFDRAIKSPDPKGSDFTEAVSNTGTIIADGGNVLLTTSDAKRVVENLINMDGIIQANTAKVKKGEIILRAERRKESSQETNSNTKTTSKEKTKETIKTEMKEEGPKGIVSVKGKIEAKGEKKGEQGGKITILGELLSLENDATLDVSGLAGGGQIFVGGGYKGENKENLPLAKGVDMGYGASAKADALENGPGGMIVLNSEECTCAHGVLSAEGGPLGGDGGIIETSSKRVDTTGSKINASAAEGKPGLWLLDPANVNISVNPPSNGGFSGVNPQTWTPTVSPSNVNTVALQGLLNAGTSVIIQTAGGVGGVGDINILDALVTGAAAGVSLTLNADNSIIFAGTGSITGVNLTLILRAAITNNLGAIFGNGSVNVGALQISRPFTNALVDPLFNIGFPDPTGGHPGTALSFVGGRTDGGNIVLLNFVPPSPARYFFNNNPLFTRSASGAPPILPPPSIINQVTNPGNFVPPASPPPVANPSAPPPYQIIPPRQPQGPTPPPPPSAPPPPPPPGQAAVPPSTPSTPAVPETPPPSSGPPASPYPPELIPGGPGIIGGLPEGREPITTAEAAGGKEGIAEGSFNTEAEEKTESDSTPCPSNVEDKNQSIPRECPKKPTGPVRNSELANEPMAPNSLLVKEEENQPVDPDSVVGMELASGFGVIGGSDEQGHETPESAEGAEGREGIVDAYPWSIEDVDRSPEFLENIGPPWHRQKRSNRFIQLWGRRKVYLCQFPENQPINQGKVSKVSNLDIGHSGICPMSRFDT